MLNERRGQHVSGVLRQTMIHIAKAEWSWGMNVKITPKHQEARALIPDDLKEEFDKLVEDYRFHAMLRHGAPFVSYILLADLILDGWRRNQNTREPNVEEKAAKPDSPLRH